MNIIVIKRSDYILISCNGKKLIIEKNNKLFDELKDLSKEDIRVWYKERKYN